MRVNFLEELVAEWYEYEGYFVRRNVLVGKGPKGGHEGELDVVAFHPKTKHLVHIEPSYDSHSWESREDSYTKKFAAGRKYIPGMFSEILPDAAPDQIEQIALIAYIGKDRPFAGGTAKSLRAFSQGNCWQTLPVDDHGSSTAVRPLEGSVVRRRIP